MAQLRFKALEKVQNRKKIKVKPPSNKISDYFESLIFGMDQMKGTLSPSIFNKVRFAIENRKKIDEETAEAVAAAVRIWSMNKGITHFTHWFQPLTGATAEKHDAFYDPQKGIENL